MKKDLTEIVCVIDRSGSMESVRSDAIGGFNSFIKAQKELPGMASVTLILFDDKYEVPYRDININSVELLDDKTFVPRGSTALLDAIGRAITETGAALDKKDEADRPEKVIICILTDGQENASREFSKSKIKEMIDHQKSKYNWEFCYLSADANGFADATSYGISKDMYADYQNTGAGTRGAYLSMSAKVSKFRSQT